MRALLLLLLLAVAAVWFGALPPGLLPPAWDPNAPLDVRAEPGPLLGLKLRRLRGDPALCRAALAGAGSRARPVPDVPVRDGCGLQDAVRVSGGGGAGGVGFEPGPFLASCPLAVGWAFFEAHVLQPAARRHFDRPVVEVAHLGSYACRDVRGGAARSSHATADALDVSGFTLRGGCRSRTGRGRKGAPRRRPPSCGRCATGRAGSSGRCSPPSTTGRTPTTCTCKRRGGAGAGEGGGGHPVTGRRRPGRADAPGGQCASAQE